ncbi:enoyl-CoA hydratase/isomerase family protein [Acinetobacter sp. ANC 5414]|uniref:enoyl-CoA hydratase/isomerase family protein n=1 Tax=Acinetobacter sp. ANC 5414 TaxID=2731251 RepID=UPI00148F70E1|nr:enoyl-CoA hydratase/isomerase family protein [Acinetobacter sp. ANC 5414]NNH01795.1 enoyl-CoA hydratase/isomerase family protein [Acinetobacter sp. ANC 5414]
MSDENNLVIRVEGGLGIISLDRTSHLNALTLPMIQGIQAQLEQWLNDSNVQAILVNSNSPKAFCAGGDIRYLYDSYKAGNTGHRDYFAAEYVMLNTLRKFAKPVIVFLDGYVLGGGFGLAQACHIKVTSEKSRFAMPETAIGFFPDVGATHFLSRLDEIGVYLALTGEQISSSDALYLDLVDYHIPSDKFAELQAALIAESSLNNSKIRKIISDFITDPAESELQKRADHINQHFAYEKLEDIEHSLAHETNSTDQAWADKTLTILQQRPLMAKQTSLKLQQVGQNLSLEKCMQLERDLQDIWLEQGDFIEGVRALIIDKDKNPQWQTDNSTFEKTLEKLWPVWNKQSIDSLCYK